MRHGRRANDGLPNEIEPIRKVEDHKPAEGHKQKRPIKKAARDNFHVRTMMAKARQKSRKKIIHDKS